MTPYSDISSSLTISIVVQRLKKNDGMSKNWNNHCNYSHYFFHVPYVLKEQKATLIYSK
jgi:hypothetical protein